MYDADGSSLPQTRAQLQQQLLEADARLWREMLARGFDPAQGENMALTGPLAKLYLERENLRAQLDELLVSEKSRD